jgi:hypothetical protein
MDPMESNKKKGIDKENLVSFEKLMNRIKILRNLEVVISKKKK